MAARRGISSLLSSSRNASSAYRITSRTFSTSPIFSAFSNSTPRAATSTSSSSSPSTAAKPTTSATTDAAKPAAKPTTTTTSTADAPRTVTPSFPAKGPPIPTSRASAADSALSGQRSLTDGLDDQPAPIEGVPAIDWTRSYHGLGSVSFTPEQSEVLLAPIQQDDVEVKPDGLLYLPEIKLVSIARGEQQYFDPDGIPTATEGCKSNALMRCCKDLGIASELWDPRFIRTFTKEMTKEVWVEHVVTKKKKKVVIRKDDTVRYPFKATA
ncbi:hypothetical protein GRF29_112g369645 [Pseudopithomyces chartarum]|uniref:Mitochondrial genome maintenance protein MGM101 n=1 Tax=Pseudopithomyces chartarum TaxID=1892770 RepID=A0AAN6REY4_9PLEO|nr:hypothetical protein GRF29_112g369645 [Pseudopithomyces chartarum]